MLLLNLVGCSKRFKLKIWDLFFSKNSSTNKKNNNINSEIIKNYSKAISREPNNFFFYLERGRLSMNMEISKGQSRTLIIHSKLNQISKLSSIEQILNTNMEISKGQ